MDEVPPLPTSKNKCETQSKTKPIQIPRISLVPGFEIISLIALGSFLRPGNKCDRCLLAPMSKSRPNEISLDTFLEASVLSFRELFEEVVQVFYLNKLMTDSDKSESEAMGEKAG